MAIALAGSIRRSPFGGIKRGFIYCLCCLFMKINPAAMMTAKMIR